MRPFALKTALVLVAAVYGISAQAGFVLESEPNSSIATADNVDGSFTTNSLPWIQDSSGNNISTSFPHVTIIGLGLNDVFSPGPAYDYFSFTVAEAGQQGVFDVDSFGLSDTELYLFDGAGTLLAENDDNVALDTGSTTLLDPFLEYTFAAAGLYVIGIGGVGSIGVNGGIVGPGLSPSDVYFVNASLSAVPEPVSILLFGAAAAGLVYSRRRRKLSVETAPEGSESAAV